MDQVLLVFVLLYIVSHIQGGPSWTVPTGRRDGTISLSSEAVNNIPPPTSNFTNLQRLFGNQGLDLKDLVLLSGNPNVLISKHIALLNSMAILIYLCQLLHDQVLTPLASLIVHPSLPDCIISLGWAIRTLLWTVNMLQISRQGSAQILMIIPQLLRWTPEAARLSTLATTLSC